MPASKPTRAELSRANSRYRGCRVSGRLGSMQAKVAAVAVAIAGFFGAAD